MNLLEKEVEKEIAGREPITVRIGDTDRPLVFSLYATIIYSSLTGDSLFVRENFDKIDVRADPDRWLKCLWASLHEFRDGKWTVPVTLEELGALVNFSNAGEISMQMAKAIGRAFAPPAIAGGILPD